MPATTWIRIDRTSPHWPQRWHLLHDAPTAALVTGNPAVLNTRALAIVGTRGATPRGLAVARRLALLGGRVTVAARSPEQRANARCSGCRAAALTALPALLPGFDAVINTIPAPVLPRALLQKLPGGALIIDLASLPGGRPPPSRAIYLPLSEYLDFPGVEAAAPVGTTA